MRVADVVGGKLERPLAKRTEDWARASLDLHAGVVLRHAGGWTASMPMANFLKEGSELEVFPESLEDSLPPGLWVSNWDAAVGADGEGRRFRGDSFYRSSLEDVGGEWGVSLTSRPGADDVARMAMNLQRLLHTVNETGQRLLDNPPADWMPAGEEWARGGILARPSLGTALMELLGPGIPPDPPPEQGIGDIMEEVYARGLYARQPEDDEEVFVARIPALRHARKVLEETVPSAGVWQCVEKEEGEDEEDVRRFIEETLKAGLRPVIVLGRLMRRNVDASSGLVMLVGDVTLPSGRRPRSCVVSDDLMSLRQHKLFTVEGLLLGPGWVPSPFLSLLRHLEGEGEDADPMNAAYWSVQMAAENILCAAMRRSPRGRRKSSGNMAAAWYAARDRAQMMGGWNRLQEAGASPLSGYAGRIRFTAPPDPGVLARVADAAWDAGLLLDARTLMAFREAGVEQDAQKRSRSLWRGSEEEAEKVYASMVYKGMAEVLDIANSIRHAPGRSERRRMWDRLLNGSRPAPCEAGAVKEAANA